MEGDAGRQAGPPQDALPNAARPIARIAVFTGDLNFSVRKGIRDILDHFEGVEVHVLLHRPQRRKARILRNQVRNLRKHGVAWIPYQAGEFAARVLSGAEPTDALGLDRPGSRYDLDALLASGRVALTELPSVNGEAARRLLERFEPDLGVSLAAPILKSRVFKCPRLGTINLHKGKLPDYRGMPPAFWEMIDGRGSVGCTVHQVEEALDTGSILIEAESAVDSFSTPDGMRIKLDALGNELLIRAIDALACGTIEPRRQDGKGRTNTRPPLGLERRFRRQLAAREGTGGNVRRAKDVILSGYSALHEGARRLRPPGRGAGAIVLLFHRVNDSLRDNVTIGIERFDRHLAYLKRHYPVVPLRALVRGEVESAGRRPLVCITFDDGYRDNFDFAAPILLKHRLHATFFVSTDKITRQSAFEHDLRKLGHGLPNMTWDQIRQMRRDGLDFGSHTVNHANLAEIGDDRVWQELVESRETLRAELGQEEFLFAYPFGGKDDITPAARDLVRKAGYVCCCSAYGGTNATPIDTFNVLRIGVNYNFSPAALRSRLNGWR